MDTFSSDPLVWSEPTQQGAGNPHSQSTQPPFPSQAGSSPLQGLQTSIPSSAPVSSRQEQVVPSASPIQSQQTQPLTYSNHPEGMEKDYSTPSSRNVGTGVVKLLLLIFIPLSLTALVVSFLNSRNNEIMYMQTNNVVLSVPMKDVNWQDLGTVFEPVITIPIKTQSGYEKWEFLLDSGAVVSSLPREWAEKIGQDLAFLKRSTFRGFGGKTSFAYQGEMSVLLGEEDKVVPVVFTEASGTKSLLGRKGFFEDYSIYFNHKDKQIEIRK